MRERKKNKLKVFTIIGIVIIFLVGIMAGGYLLIDKGMVPNYLGKYGINNLHELVQLANTIYKTPTERELITNPYTVSDSAMLTEKLTNAGFPVLTNGDINYPSIANNEYTLTPSDDFTDSHLILIDTEIASMLNTALKADALTNDIPNISFLDTSNIDILELSINPQTTEVNVETNIANIDIITKLNTKAIRSQMAKNLDTPPFLIDWLIPDIMYLKFTFDVKINSDGDYEYNNCALSVNAKTAEQSEVLLNLLISFIYPEEQNVTIEVLSNEFCTLATSCINILGDYSYIKTNLSTSIKNGIYLVLS